MKLMFLSILYMKDVKKGEIVMYKIIFCDGNVETYSDFATALSEVNKFLETLPDVGSAEFADIVRELNASYQASYKRYGIVTKFKVDPFFIGELVKEAA